MINEKFWLAIAFLSFATLIIKFVGPRIAKALDNKSKQIAEEILIAKELREKAQQLLLDAEAYHKESVEFAQKILKDAGIEANNFASESRRNLEAEVAKRTAAALERIRIEEENAIREIKTKIITTALDSLSTNLNLDQKNHEQLVNKAVQDFEKLIH